MHPHSRAHWPFLSAELPSLCVVCHAWPAQPVCEACTHHYARPVHRCEGCGLPLATDHTLCGTCLRAPEPSWDACYAAVSYSYPWDHILGQFKFAGQAAWAVHLAQMMLMQNHLAEALASAEVIVPIPLADTRLRERGYNQSARLAQHLARGKVHEAALVRTRATTPQANLGQAQRLSNMRGAFAVPAQQAKWVANRHLLLIDDVMTTGATLRAASGALKAAGAARVTVMAFARTASA